MSEPYVPYKKDPTITILDNYSPSTMEPFFKDGTLSSTALYGSFQIPLLVYFILYRNPEVGGDLKELLELTLKYGGDVNQCVMDTDDIHVTPLFTAVQYYLGMCLEKVSPSRKDKMLRIIAFLVKNGANPEMVLPNNESVVNNINIYKADTEIMSHIKLTDIDKLVGKLRSLP